MKAEAVIAAVVDDRGRTILRELRSGGPLALRDTPHGLFLVGAAAGPIGGDDVTLTVTVGPGAHLVVRSAAASLALPGVAGGPSYLRIEADVAGTLEWLPEPVIAGRACLHTQRSAIRLGADAILAWREEIVLGRYGEEPGTYVSDISIDRSGHTLLRQRLTVGAASSAFRSPAVVGQAKATGSISLVDPRWAGGAPESAALTGTSAVLGLAGPGVQICAVADAAPELRELLNAGWAYARGTAISR